MVQAETRTLVKQAADALLAEGTRPTVMNVRARTGRGSAGTINAALQEWWQALAGRLVQVESRPEIPEPVFAAAEQLWGAALEQAETVLAKESEKLARAREIARAEVEAACQGQRAAEERATKLAHRLEILEETRLKLERRLAETTAQGDNLNSQLNEVREVLNRKEQFLQEQATRYEMQLTREREQSLGLEQHLVAQLDEQKTARERLERSWRQRESRWQEREGVLQQQWEKALRQVAQAQERLGLLEENLQEAKREVQLLRQAREQGAAEVATLRGECNQVLKERKQWQTQAVELRRQLKGLDVEREALVDQLRQSGAQLTLCKGEIRSLKTLLDRLIPMPERGSDPAPK